MNVAVLGGGIMGSGIAQVAASVGHDVCVFDLGTAELDRAQAAIESSLDRLARKGRITTDERSDTLARLRFASEIVDAVGNADAVVEAVPEQLELKQEVLARVAAAAPDHCLLATNTSQLSITAIGANLGPAASRLVGMHFFNPPVLMDLVELIAGDATSAETLERAHEFARGLGKETVLCQKDIPGFITTRCSVILRLECLRMLEEGVATAEDIDKALRLGLNHPMGPLELGDLVGLDTFLRSADALAETHGERFEAPSVARELVAAGRFGRKSGRGIYSYDSEGRKSDG
ncbi:MAG: 3-hydroxyacyl-CoA dehydrogenase family protein [Gaiellaceae bacterium]